MSQFRRRGSRSTPWLVLALAIYPVVSRAQQTQPPPPYPAPPPVTGAPSPSVSRLLVGPGSGRNLSANIILRARAYLLAAAAEMCPTCQVVDAGAVAQAAPIDGQMASSLAGHFNADVVLALDLDRAQGLTRLTLVAFRRASPDGRPAQPQMLRQSTNEGPETLWPVVRTLVWRLYQGAADPSPPLASIAQPPPAAPRQFFLAAGGGMVAQLNSAARTDLLLPAVAVAVAYHADASLIDVRLDLATKDDAHRRGLGLSYSVRTGPNVSFGLAAAWVWMNLGGRGATGPAVQPMIGYLLPVAGGPSFRFEAGYVLNLFREQQVDRLIPGSDAAHWSHGPQFLIGVVL